MHALVLKHGLFELPVYDCVAVRNISRRCHGLVIYLLPSASYMASHVLAGHCGVVWVVRQVLAA